MAQYQIKWTEEVWYEQTIEAESQEKAKELFWSEGFPFDTAQVFGSEIQDSVEIEEVE
jgi:hypothetical protein